MKPVLRKQENSKIQGFTITGNISLISTADKVQSNQNSIYIHTTMSVKEKIVASFLFTFLESVKWETHL